MIHLPLAETSHVPHLLWAAPFAALLVCVAILPLVPATHHWWERNRNKLLVGLALGLLTLAYYGCRDFGATPHDPFLVQALHAAGLEIHEHDGHALAAPGWPTAFAALGNSLMEYLPFIILLFSLYTVCGGIAIRGDIPAHPLTNTAFLAVGGLLASFVGTTGASMLLIRPLLQTNSERRRVRHTVIFFIFIVSNCGGCLLPIGDPPLFLGYLRGVPFLWTWALWKEWLLILAVLLVVYYIWDSREYRHEPKAALRTDEARVQRLHLAGWINFLWLALVVLAVGTLDPSKPFLHTTYRPPPFLREAIMLSFVGLSWLTTPHGLRHAMRFNFHPITEVACLFIGIFLTMQVPLEILHARGAQLGITQPWQFFWATGALSSFLDNAPTYVVFFETANALTHHAGPGVLTLLGGEFIRESHLVAVSLGAVFMGAMTYIGNGPNFMVKAIAEHAGVKMPSFFGYLGYSCAVLLPILLALTILFMC
jgi:Na+/H+ antiporter NhaD/arsenite permease-like protein